MTSAPGAAGAGFLAGWSQGWKERLEGQPVALKEPGYLGVL